MRRRVSVIGAGNMGQGFAVHFGLHDQDVTLVDHRESNLERATARIRDAASGLAAEGLTERSPGDVLEGITFTTDRDAGVSGADVVLETVPEDLELKREVFAAVAAAAPDDAILASNTSGIPITDLAKAVPSAAGRVVGCHWWFPPYLLEPVEVVRGAGTTDRTMERIRAFVEDVDRRPIVVERDVPGFVWNRVQNAVIRECLHLVEAGVASIEDVNAAVRDGYARRTSVIGPFETMDIAGVDQFETVAAHLYPHLCDDDEPNDAFAEHLEAGHLGVETGRGFFEYDEPAEAVMRRRDERLAALDRRFDAMQSE
ncbi:3-hydroxyacyl-CoA dehydrogenase family protein [Halorarum salinum]|uniref:3-hydroxyacyl-CoA dehydrogenase family protein n=1 Tax=Halorarum salinum TaxID=2743089 RepID=A0A7D5QGU7_9EURY|nr:3-hydroxyacyl-CoA dehydrogenase NAD-binding domain-containing protein [Halobaculum salinum]QLG61744.1 3-hydroxyacyl-CoA dehydrogenase family protein [Halobaculum salinum]